MIPQSVNIGRGLTRRSRPRPHARILRAARMKPLSLAFAVVMLAARIAAADDGDDEPVTMTRFGPDAERAKCQFEAGQWADAAVAFDRAARGETERAPGATQAARLYLAIALHRLGLHDASLRAFGAIASSPSNVGFLDARRWLVALDAALPEPAGVARHVGRYRALPIQKTIASERDFAGNFNYLIGKHAYDRGAFAEAAYAFDEVDASSQRYLVAQFMGGMCFVQLRKGVPAVERFQRIVDAIDDKTKDEELRRLRDLSLISMSRTRYSASVVHESPSEPTIGARRLGSGAKFWNQIEVRSPLWPDAQLESSWAYFFTGDYARALGNLHNLESGYVEATSYPEADIVRGIIALRVCQYDDALTIAGRSRRRYLPLRRDLRALLNRLAGEDDEGMLAFYDRVRRGHERAPRSVKPALDALLPDRPIQKNIAYLRHLDIESRRLRALPSSFRQSPLGEEVESGLARARQTAHHDIALRVRVLLQRRLDALDAHLVDLSRLATDAGRAMLDERRERAAGTRPAPNLQTWGMLRPDVEHTIWPFDGEFWRDELGTYRQVVVSRCAR